MSTATNVDHKWKLTYSNTKIPSTLRNSYSQAPYYSVTSSVQADLKFLTTFLTVCKVTGFRVCNLLQAFPVSSADCRRKDRSWCVETLTFQVCHDRCSHDGRDDNRVHLSVQTTQPLSTTVYTQWVRWNATVFSPPFICDVQIASNASTPNSFQFSVYFVSIFCITDLFKTFTNILLIYVFCLY